MPEKADAGAAASSSEVCSAHDSPEACRLRQEAGLSKAPRKLILASHSRVASFDVDTGETIVIHEGRGVYHGIVPADDGANEIWVTSRPHNDVEYSTPESLLRINVGSGALLQEQAIPSKFTHEAVRKGDRLFVANTGAGQILEFRLPSLELINTHSGFTKRDHVNTLHVADDGKSLWVMCHGKGPSRIVHLDLTTDEKLEEVTGVGHGAHSVLAWRDSFLMLDSNNGRLVAYNHTTKKTEAVWTSSVRGAGGNLEFLKGLVVVEDVAYFGVSPPRVRNNRKAAYDAEIAAFDLRGRVLLWKRPARTQGLLNIIAAPHLAESSTYRAVERWQ